MDTNEISRDAMTMNRREALKRAGLFLGAALSASTMSGTLHAQAKAASGGGGNLGKARLSLVEAIAERILPKTDTPGALDAGVPAFIDVMCGDYLTGDERRTLFKGLTAVNTASREAHKKSFMKLSASQQDEVLRGIAESDQAFFRKMRELTISGYFTSELVMKNVLNYDFIPGMWKGCVDISEVGNVVWAH